MGAGTSILLQSTTSANGYQPKGRTSFVLRLPVRELEGRN